MSNEVYILMFNQYSKELDEVVTRWPYYQVIIGIYESINRAKSAAKLCWRDDWFNYPTSESYEYTYIADGIPKWVDTECKNYYSIQRRVMWEVSNSFYGCQHEAITSFCKSNGIRFSIQWWSPNFDLLFMQEDINKIKGLINRNLEEEQSVFESLVMSEDYPLY